MNREQAIKYIVNIIRHPLAIMSRPMYDMAIKEAQIHGISAIEILKAMKTIRENT